MLRIGCPCIAVSTLIQRRMGRSDSGSAVVAAHHQVSLDGAVVVVARGGLVAAIAASLIA